MPKTIEKLSIEVGHDLSEDELKEALQGHVEELEGFLVTSFDLERINSRASLCSDAFEIIAVSYSGDAMYGMDYQFEWEAYWGCKDMNTGDTEIDFIQFSYIDGYAVFEREMPEPRYPKDEL